MLIDIHSHYMPKELARALERRSEAPRIFRRDGKPVVEYGAGSVTPLTPVFSDPEQIIERMNEAGIDHAVLSVTIPGVDWLDADAGQEVADASAHQVGGVIELAEPIENLEGIGIHVTARERMLRAWNDPRVSHRLALYQYVSNGG